MKVSTWVIHLLIAVRYVKSTIDLRHPSFSLVFRKCELLAIRGSYHLHVKTRNFGWKIKWFSPLCLRSFSKYRKIPKIGPGAYIFQRPFRRGLFSGGAYIRRGLSTEGNLRFQLHWVSLIVGGKFTVFALFYLVFEGNFPSRNPQGAYIWRGDLTEGFLRYRFGGLIFGGAYFRNFTVWDVIRPSQIL